MLPPAVNGAVASTLHADDAASAPARLLEMGVERFLVTSALTGAVTNAWCARCEQCREPYQPDEAGLVAAGWDEAVAAGVAEPTFFRAVGRARCARSG